MRGYNDASLMAAWRFATKLFSVVQVANRGLWCLQVGGGRGAPALSQQVEKVVLGQKLPTIPIDLPMYSIQLTNCLKEIRAIFFSLSQDSLLSYCILLRKKREWYGRSLSLLPIRDRSQSIDSWPDDLTTHDIDTSNDL